MHGRVAVPAWALRAVKVGTVTMVAAGLVLAVALVAWPHLFSSGAGRLRPGPGGSLIGEAEGWVKSAEPSTSTIRVSSGFLGLSSVSLVVAPDTLIIVGGKEGGFGDMYEGRRVRAAYEERPDGFRAKSIEVVVDGARAEHRQTIGQPASPDEPSPSTVGRPADDGLRPDRSTSGPVGNSLGERARNPIGSRTVIPGAASRDMAPDVAPRAYKRQADSQIDPQTPGAAPSTRRSVQTERPPDSRRSSPPANIRRDEATQAP
jgi:hypothetical protein